MRTLSAILATIFLASCAGGQSTYYNRPPPPPPPYDGGYGYNDGYDDRAGGRWDDRYPGPYSYNDDAYYRNCRNQSDPAGVIGGALIGGLLGNALSSRGNRAGPTVAGVVLGGIAGAALTNRMTCEDQSYAYRTYHHGLNQGPGRYTWENPETRHRGEFYVDDYYRDEYGNRCAEYSQSVWIEGRPEEARGYACQQPDGTWNFVS